MTSPSVWTLTDARVKGRLRFQDVGGGEVDDVAGEAELAADAGFRLQQRKSVDLGSGAASCDGGASRRHNHKLLTVNVVVSNLDKP